MFRGVIGKFIVGEDCPGNNVRSHIATFPPDWENHKWHRHLTGQTFLRNFDSARDRTEGQILLRKFDRLKSITMFCNSFGINGLRIDSQCRWPSKPSVAAPVSHPMTDTA